MGRLFVAGTSDIAYVPSMPLAGTADWVMAAWFYRTDNTQANKIVFESSSTKPGFDVVCNTALNGGGTDLVRSYDTSVQWADTYVAPAAGAWHHYVWVIAGNGPGSPPGSINLVYIDGVSQTLTTVGHNFPVGSPTSDDFSFMGRRQAGVSSTFLSGRLAEWALWSSPTMRANPAPWVARLYTGACPLRVRETELLMYIPFYGSDSPEPDYHGAQRNATLGGSSARTNHPMTARGLVNFQD